MAQIAFVVPKHGDPDTYPILAAVLPEGKPLPTDEKAVLAVVDVPEELSQLLSLLDEDVWEDVVELAFEKVLQAGYFLGKKGLLKRHPELKGLTLEVLDGIHFPEE